MKDIQGYEGLYAITEDGQVWSYRTKKFLAQQIKKGYYHVHLSKEGKAKYVAVHRLVALAYVNNPNPQEWNIINHKDENPLNNHKDNLEWCNNKYNDNYGNRNLKNSISNRNSNKQGVEIRCVETGIIYPSFKEASRQTGIYAAGIARVCKGLQEKCGGLHWEYTGNKFHNFSEIKRVQCIETKIIYESVSQAERETNICGANISKVCKGERKTAGGFHWKFVN